MKQRILALGIVCLAALAGFAATAAYADSSETAQKEALQKDSMRKMITTPITSSQNAADVAADDSVIRLTPDGSKIIHLEQDAASVIVNNPKNAGVILDNPRLLVVMPKEPGTTSFTVLDANGKTILERRVIVTGAQQKYIRVRRMCSGGGNDCVPSSYFYCPDGCYEVNPVPGADGVTQVPEVRGGAASASPAEEPIAPGVAPDTGLSPSEEQQPAGQPAEAPVPQGVPQ